MNEIYQVSGIRKQAFHQHLERGLRVESEQQELLGKIERLRQEHPRISARQMYALLKPQTMGRDRFIEFCFSKGYRLERKRCFHRTTDSRGVIRFPNLIAGREFRGVNRVWVSDITYYRIGNIFYYLTFITDLFSRFIVGYSVSETLRTEETIIAALKMALKQRKPPKELILHSDCGSQYNCKELLKITRKHHIRNSMGKSVYENPHAERVIGTIKNDYLIPFNPQDFNSLKRMVKKAINNYNFRRPHKSLNGATPGEYEKLLTKNASY